MQHNDTFLAKHKHSAPHVHAALETRHALDDSPDTRARDQRELIQTLEIEEGDGEGITLQDAIQGLHLLKWWESDAEVVKEYKAKAKERWAEATAFE